MTTASATIAATDGVADKIPFKTLADKALLEATPLSEKYSYQTTLDVVAHSAERFGDKTAVSFQLKGDAKSPIFRMSFRQLWDDARRAANAYHAAGAQPGDTIAVLLPNMPDTMVAMYGAQALGCVNPINPLLEPEIIGSILRESEATVLVTLAPFPKTDVAEKAAKAVALAPNVKTIIEVDLLKYLKGPLRIVAPLLRPKRVQGHGAQIVNFAKALKSQPGDRLTFQREITPDTIGAMFHTGGTTGTPKLAQHNHRGMVYNGWTCSDILFGPEDVFLCALPLFHVFANYPMGLAAICSGAELAIITPQGFRGDGVIENFWKLIERHKVTFFAAVPTAISALDQRPVDADVSSLNYLLSGSAPLPTALFQRFEQNTNVKILEGYGMTEATCVTSCNPPAGERRIGSVGFPLPFTEVRIALFDGDGAWSRDCAPDEIGEICFKGPAVFPGYKEDEKNQNLFFDPPIPGEGWLRTGDLGRVDADGYIWITGRAKDLIIRGGHNIDPGLIEEALAQHPAVAFVGAIGQPDAYAGELPCAYVELKDGATASTAELQEFANQHLAERAARPAAVTVMPELPKTAVGKTFKPALRKEAIARVFGEALEKEGLVAEIEVEDDPKLGMIAVLHSKGATLDEAAIAAALNGFARPWRIE
ncbi:MAG: acyl-CoA synthetase [Pseudomonadota bacterium]